MTSTVSNRLRPSVVDVLILVLGIVGAVSFTYLLPAQHPDSTAKFGLQRDEIIDRANIFLTSQGYPTDGMIVEAHLNRNAPLLKSLQHDLGRIRTIEALRSAGATILPAYFWSVRYRWEDADAESGSIFKTTRQAFEVRLTQNGVVWSFINDMTGTTAPAEFRGIATRSVNRRALANAFAPADSLVRETRIRLDAVPDSVLRYGLQFDRPDGLEGNGTIDTASINDPLTQLQIKNTATLSPSVIEKLADYYTPRPFRDAISWSIDSLWIAGGYNNQIAGVWLLSQDESYGQEIRLEMRVSSTGNLLSSTVSFNPDEPTRNSTSELIDAVRVGLYLLLFVILMISFFRRMIAHLIDVKSALLDAVIMGLLFGVYVVLNREITFTSTITSLWVRVGTALLIFSFSAGGMAFVAFVISSVGESTARDAWARKLYTMALIRKGDLQNNLAGTAILRGVGLAGILLGIAVLWLSIFPNEGLSLQASLLNTNSLRPVLSAATGNAATGFLAMIILLLVVGTFLYRLGQHTTLVVAGITIVGAFLQITSFDLSSGWIAIGVSGLTSFVIALAFVRFDMFTAFTGFFLARFVWKLSEGFLIIGSPAWLDFLLGSLFVLSVIVLGFLGLTSRRSGRDIESVIPDYIAEMAGQERIKRELEIAHHVQASFLPQTMPHVDGLDIAGMCLPASEVGGDYFDFIKLGPDRLAFVVGDVSGKGIEAAFYMTLVKGIIQTLSRSVDSPATVMKRLNGLFRSNAPAGTFISVIYGVVDVSTGQFTFARAGHNPAIYLRSSDSVAHALRPAGMAIGFTDAEIFDPNIEETKIDLSVGDTLVFYTDGFSEAMNTSRELYTDERLVHKVSHVGHRSASAILRSVSEDVHHFIEGAGRSDDMTMVVIKLLQTA